MPPNLARRSDRLLFHAVDSGGNLYEHGQLLQIKKLIICQMFLFQSKSDSLLVSST
jgi:hypothetical protein